MAAARRTANEMATNGSHQLDVDSDATINESEQPINGHSLEDSASPNYDPSDYIVPAQDNKGHSERLWVRVQPMLDRQLDIIKSSKHFPFRTKGDVVRYCVDKTVRELLSTAEKAGERLASVMTQVDVIKDFVRDEIYHQDFISTFEDFNRAIQRYVGTGALGEAKRMIAQVDAYIDRMPECYWKTEYKKKMDKDYGHLYAGETDGSDRRKKPRAAN